MSLETTTNKSIFQGNAATTVFSYSFIIPTADDAVVTFTDDEGTQTILVPAQYTITGLADANGGTITYPLVGSPMANGESLTLQRIVAYTQPTVLTNQTNFYPDVVEGADDYIVMQTQQLAEAVSRSIRFPAVDPAINAVAELSAWQTRANKAFFFDASGNAEFLDMSGGAATSSANVNFLQAGVGAVSRTVESKEQDIISVLDFIPTALHAGIRAGSNTTNLSTYINTAITAWKVLLTETSGDNSMKLYGVAALYFPHGFYLVNTTLDFTAIRVISAIIRMEGTIIGKTSGTPIIDMTDSRWLSWDFMNLQAPEAATAPNVGVLLARRASDTRVAGEHYFNHPVIQGNFTVAPWYNYGSELSLCVRPIFFSYYTTGTPVVQYTVGQNVASITSPYQTIATTDLSMVGAKFIGADFRALGAGYVSRLDGIDDIDMTGYCSMGGSGSRDSFHKLTLLRASNPTGININMHHEAPALTVSSIMDIVTNASRHVVDRIEIVDHGAQTVDDVIAVLGFSGPDQLTVHGFDTTGGFTSSSRRPFVAISGGTAYVKYGNIVNTSNSPTDTGGINLASLTAFTGRVQTEAARNITLPVTYSMEIVTGRKSFIATSESTSAIVSGDIAIVAAQSNRINITGEGGLLDDLVTLTPDTAGATPGGLVMTLRNNAAYDITVKNTGAAYSIRTKSGSDVILTASQQKTISLMMWIGATDGTTNRWEEV